VVALGALEYATAGADVGITKVARGRWYPSRGGFAATHPGLRGVCETSRGAADHATSIRSARSARVVPGGGFLADHSRQHSLGLGGQDKPDRARPRVDVCAGEGSAETAADAVTRGATKLNAVSEALRALGRAELDRPVTYSVGSMNQPNGFSQPTGQLPSVSRTVMRVHVNRVDQVTSVAAAVLGAGRREFRRSRSSHGSGLGASVRMTDVLAMARSDAHALGGPLGGLVDVSSGANNIGFVGPTNLNFGSRFMQPTQVPEVSISTS
jgi:hypothetical protein